MAFPAGAARASSPAAYSSAASPMNSLGVSLGRMRSVSPSRWALANDMRHLAGRLRDAQGTGSLMGTCAAPGEASASPSACSSPPAAWVQGDSGAAPVRLARSPAVVPRGVAMHHQFSAVAEKVNVVITSLQRQCEQDRRRLTQLERKVDARLDDMARESESRHRWAEVQGSVSGLIEETQGLTRRVEGLDERLSQRTSGNELTKQRARELDQQVQSLEQQMRLALASVEELQKRQATKLRRSEHTMEELSRRLQKAEEAAVRLAQPPRESYLEARITNVEQHIEELLNENRSLQMQLDEGLHSALAATQAAGTHHHDYADGGMSIQTEEAIHRLERNLASVEKKVVGQVEDLASSLANVRVKVDGQFQRVATLAERMETAHTPAIDALRAEVMQMHGQGHRDLDNDHQALKSQLRHHREAQEEMALELKEEIRQTRAELAAVSLHRSQEDASGHGTAIRSLHERMQSYEQELDELKGCYPTGIPPPLPGSDMDQVDGLGADDPMDRSGGGGGGVGVTRAELEDWNRRLEWLEQEAFSAGAAGQEDGLHNKQVSQVQNSVYDLIDKVSRLSQRAATADQLTTSLKQQMHELQGMVEKQQCSTAGHRDLTEVDAKVCAVTQQLADISARLLEVEGNLDFAREAGDLKTPSSSNALAAAMGEHTQGHLAEKLDSIVEHLEFLDELAERVAELERRSSQSRGVAPTSPGRLSEVSFGGDAPLKQVEISCKSCSNTGIVELTGKPCVCKYGQQAIPSKEAPCKNESMDVFEQDLDKLRGRLDGNEAQLKSLQAAASKQEVSSAELERGLRTVTTNIEGVVETVTHLKMEVKEATALATKATSEVKEASRCGLAELETRLSKEITSTRDADRQQLSDFKDRLAELTAKLAAPPSSGDLGPFSENLKALEVKLGALEDKCDESLVALEKEIKSMPDTGTQIGDIQKKLAQAKIFDGMPVGDRVDDMSKGLNEQKAIGRSNRDQLEALTTRLVDVEVALSTMKEVTMSTNQVVSSAEEDEKSRLEVQKTVETLSVQVAKELGSLAEHQKELVGQRSSLEALSLKVDSIAADAANRTMLPAPAPVDLGPLKSEVATLSSRIGAVEKRSTEMMQFAEKKLVDDLLKDVGKTKSEVLGFRAQMDRMDKALKNAEESVNILKAQLDSSPSNPSRKVGIAVGDTGLSSSAATTAKLEKMSERLEELSDQVAELKERGVAGTSRVRGPSPSTFSDHAKEGSLNFSLTEQDFSVRGNDSKKGPPQDLADNSLDFSLTGVGGMSPGGSLSMDNRVGRGGATGLVAKDNSLRLVAPPDGPHIRGEAKVGITSGNDTPDDASSEEDISISSTPKEQKMGFAVTQKDALKDNLHGALRKVSEKAEEVDDVLDGLVCKGDKDAAGLGGRPRPSALASLESSGGASGSLVGLARVEEGDECGDMSASSQDKKNPLDHMQVGAQAKAVNFLSPPSKGSPRDALEASMASVTSDRNEVSVSCQDISMGPDISVEDSLELEKCDFWEAVQPCTPEPATRSVVATARTAAVAPSAGSQEVIATTVSAAVPKVVAKAVVTASAVLSSSSTSTPVPAKAVVVVAKAIVPAKAVAQVAATPVQVAKAAVPAKAAGQPAGVPVQAASEASPEKNDEEYSHEAFEDDKSVPESIQESVESEED